MKKYYEKIEMENIVKKIYRLYFFESLMYLTLTIIFIKWLLDENTDFEWITLLLSIGFDKVLDGKDELFKFTTTKENKC